MTKKQLLAKFHEVDTNGDGVLSLREFRRFMKFMLKMNMSDNDIEILFDRFDQDKDGTLDLSEFTTFMEEELQNEGYNNDNLDEGYYENPLNPVSETGDTSGVFTQLWDIEDVNPIEKAKLITSTVLWLDADGVEKEVTLTAVCIDESN